MRFSIINYFIFKDSGQSQFFVRMNNTSYDSRPIVYLILLCVLGRSRHIIFLIYKITVILNRLKQFCSLKNSTEILSPKTCVQNFLTAIQAIYRGHTPRKPKPFLSKRVLVAHP